MSIYGLYFTKTLIEQMGSAKRRGLFNSEAVVDIAIAQGILNQMVDWAATLGARKPNLALKMIAWMFKEKDWTGNDRPNIVIIISGMKSKWDAAPIQAPHEAVPPIDLAKHYGKQISLKHLKDPQMRIILEQHVLDGLLWGLASPKKYQAWAEHENISMAEQLPIMQKAGLKVEYVSSSQILEDSEAMLRSYEEHVDPLPNIPAALMKDARTLGISVS